MFQLLSIGIECFSSIIFIIPAIIIVQYLVLKQHSFSRFIMLFVFALYCIAVFSVVGIPSIYTLKIYFSFNLIPFIDIINSPVSYIINTVLNIILFMPMGFLLPAIWPEYRSMKKTIFTGLAISVIIELLQIFSFRATDIDDLITNTLGTFLGYYICKVFSFKLPLITSANAKNVPIKYEPIIILVITFLIAFILKPFVSNKIWDIVLSSTLWERIK